MSNVNLESLPPEMQARIAGIINQAKQPEAPQQPAAPIQKQPTLMDHTIALRQEVAASRTAVAQDAVGQLSASKTFHAVRNYRSKRLLRNDEKSNVLMPEAEQSRLQILSCHPDVSCSARLKP